MIEHKDGGNKIKGAPAAVCLIFFFFGLMGAIY